MLFSEQIANGRSYRQKVGAMSGRRLGFSLPLPGVSQSRWDAVPGALVLGSGLPTRLHEPNGTSHHGHGAVAISLWGLIAELLVPSDSSGF